MVRTATPAFQVRTDSAASGHGARLSQNPTAIKQIRRKAIQFSYPGKAAQASRRPQIAMGVTGRAFLRRRRSIIEPRVVARRQPWADRTHPAFTRKAPR